MTRFNFQSKLVVLLGTIVLVGCASKPGRQETVVVVPPTYMENIPIPKVQPLELKDIAFKLMNRTEMQQFLDSNIGKDNFTIYALDDQNVAILIGNIQELRRYIQSQQEVIVYLKKVLDARTTKGEK